MADLADREYCRAQVRRFDRDRYLTSLFAGSQDQLDLMALYAFNVEVARTREMVREPMMGLLRLQWWRDVIEEIYAGQARRHQIVQPLAVAVRRGNLSRALFEQLLLARETDLDPALPTDMSSLFSYAEGTSASLSLLALEILVGGNQAPAADLRAAARQVGVAWALSGLLRALPFHARSGRTMLPSSVVPAAALNQADLVEFKPSCALSAAVAEIAREARRCLDAAGLDRLTVPRRLRPVFLLAVLVADDLRRLERAGFNPFDPLIQGTRPGRIWRLAPAAFLGRFQ